VGVSYFEKQITKVNDSLLQMGGVVEDFIDQATRLLHHRDVTKARVCIDGDQQIDEMENLIDRECLRLLATQQPVAVDLRFITAALKISTYLERMADQAVNICYRCLSLAQADPIPTPPTIRRMTEIAQEMLRRSLDAFVRRDVDLAFEVLHADDELDRLNRALLEEMIQFMMTENRLVRRGVELILVGRHLERIGDESTNVCEEVVFLVEGRSIKHQRLDQLTPLAKAKP
jgi:phosphate transport system protein